MYRGTVNIKYALLATLIATNLVAATDQVTYFDDEQEEDWFGLYAAPCITGGMVGCISGKISAKVCSGTFAIAAGAAISTEDKAIQGIISLAGLSAIIGTLIAENKLRAKCVDWLNEKFKNSETQPHDLIKNSARIFSWIAFLI